MHEVLWIALQDTDFFLLAINSDQSFKLEVA